MTRDLTLEGQAQEVLNEMWAEKLIPFALNVGKITKASDEYTIHFYDSRIRTAHIPLNRGGSFSGMVRSAVVDRVAKMSGPLKKLPNPGSRITKRL
jgi:hypothetical protein